MLRRHVVLLIAIRPSDGDVKPGGPVGVRRTTNRYNEPRSDFPHSTRTPAAVKAVVERICRNPLRKQEIMTKEVQIP